MLNSFTNLLHASALGTYTFLVFQGIYDNKPYYNYYIFFTFLFVFILKIIGVIVHLPYVENNRERHNFFWTIIAVLVVVLNYFTFQSIHLSFWVSFFGIGLSVLISGIYIRSLFKSTGHYYMIAGLMGIIYTMCAFLTRDVLREAWIYLLLSNLLWILLSKIPFLKKYKFHNDIYHIALICSTYFLYSTIKTGLW